MLPINRRFRLPRVWSNRELRKLAPLFHGDVVNVSAWQDQDKEGSTYRDYFTFASSYSITNFHGTRGHQGQEGEILLDLAAQLPDDLRGRFDVVYTHTVLEHIFPVWKAFQNLCEMTRDVVVTVVPWAQAQHETESYGDFWRISPTGLRALHEDNGLTTVYEAITPARNAGVYVLSVGAKHPDRWRDKLPPHEHIRKAAWWVGATLVQRLRHCFTGKAARE